MVLIMAPRDLFARRFGLMRRMPKRPACSLIVNVSFKKSPPKKLDIFGGVVYTINTKSDARRERLSSE